MSDFNGPYYPPYDPYLHQHIQQMQQMNFDMMCMKNNQDLLSSELSKIKNIINTRINFNIFTGKTTHQCFLPSQ